MIGFDFGAEKHCSHGFVRRDQIVHACILQMFNNAFIRCRIALLDLKNLVHQTRFKEKVTKAFAADKTELMFRPDLSTFFQQRNGEEEISEKGSLHDKIQGH